MIAMSLRSVSSLQRVALLFLVLSVLCSQSEENECLKDSKVYGDCPSFTATLVRPGNFSVVLGTNEKSLGSSEHYDVELTFGDCKFNVRIYDQLGIKFTIPEVDRTYSKYLSFGKSGTQLRSKEDNKELCSGLCRGDCDIHFSWGVKPVSSKVYIDFRSLELADIRGSKALSTLVIAVIIAGSVFLFLSLICVAALIVYCCKCKKSKAQKAKPEEAKSKPQATKSVKQTDLQDKKPASKEKTREEKTEGDEKTPAKPANFITSKDLMSPPKVRKDKAEFITSQDLKSPTAERQKSSSSQKEEQAPKQGPIPKVKKRTGKSTEATLERVLTSREDEKLAQKEAAKVRAKPKIRTGKSTEATFERVLTTHEDEKQAKKEAAKHRAKPKKTKTDSRDDATIVE